MVVELGEPSGSYPFQWAIYRWLDGQPWADERVHDPVGAAEKLANFVHTLQAIDAKGAPRPAPGRQGAPLRGRDPSVRLALDALEGDMDTGPIRRAWDAVLKVPAWENPPVWIHGDLLPGNVLVHGGQLSAVIDFGLVCAGDPAMDVIAAWSLFEGTGRSAYRNALRVDDATWERARGWALTGVEGMAYYARSNPQFAAECRRRVEAALDER